MLLVILPAERWWSRSAVSHDELHSWYTSGYSLVCFILLDERLDHSYEYAFYNSDRGYTYFGGTLVVKVCVLP